MQAFTDSWEWNIDARQAYEETVEAGGEVAKAMVAFRTLLSTSDILAYLSMMAPRLVELRRIRKPTGSLCLHCDPTASHYLKPDSAGHDAYEVRLGGNRRTWPRLGLQS